MLEDGLMLTSLFQHFEWEDPMISDACSAVVPYGSCYRGTAPKSVVFPGAIGRNPKLDKLTALCVAITGRWKGG